MHRDTLPVTSSTFITHLSHHYSQYPHYQLPAVLLQLSLPTISYCHIIATLPTSPVTAVSYIVLTHNYCHYLPYSHYQLLLSLRSHQIYDVIINIHRLEKFSNLCIIMICNILPVSYAVVKLKMPDVGRGGANISGSLSVNLPPCCCFCHYIYLSTQITPFFHEQM